jgi:hypothetical protein
MLRQKSLDMDFFTGLWSRLCPITPKLLIGTPSPHLPEVKRGRTLFLGEYQLAGEIVVLPGIRAKRFEVYARRFCHRDLFPSPPKGYNGAR